MPNKPTETQLTLLASRRFNRRRFLKTSTGAAAVVLAGPAYVRNARSSSGELNLLNWSDEFPGEVIPNFEKATGIKVNSTPFSQNEEQINKLQATGGEGFDLVQPTRDRAPQFQELGVLAPIDTNKLKNFGASFQSWKVRKACGPGMAGFTIFPISGAPKPFPGAPTCGRAIPPNCPMATCGPKR